MEEKFRIEEERPLHHYRTEIPNCILDAKLDPYAFQVYAHVKRRASDKGQCYMSHKHLALECRMCEKKLRDCLNKLCIKNEILGVAILQKQQRLKENGSLDTCIYRIVDLWPINMSLYCKNISGTVPHTEGVRYDIPEGTVPHTDKEDPIKKIPYKKDIVCDDGGGAPHAGGGISRPKKERTVSSKKNTGTVEGPKKYKLTEEQEGVYSWLSENCRDVEIGTRCYWAKFHSWDRIKEVYHEAKSRSPKNLGAYMNKLFKCNATVPNAQSQECLEYAKLFKSQQSWHDLQIGNRYITFKMGEDTVDIDLHQKPEDFARQLHEKYETSKKYK